MSRRWLLQKVCVIAGLWLAVTGAFAFERVEAVDFADEDFVFPDDIQGADLHLLFLSIARDQDNGTWQGEELMRWHRSLLEAGALPDTVRAWHFPVMESPPFFVKGMIRRAIAEGYVGLLPPGQGAVLYIKDLQRFADSAGLPVDGQPTVLLWSRADGVVGSWRGTVSDPVVAEISARLNPAEDVSPEAPPEERAVQPDPAAGQAEPAI